MTILNKIEEIGQKIELKKVTLAAGILTGLSFLFALIIGELVDALSKGAISVFFFVLYSRQ